MGRSDVPGRHRGTPRSIGSVGPLAPSGTLVARVRTVARSYNPLLSCFCDVGTQTAGPAAGAVIAVVGTDPHETASVTTAIVERFAGCRYAAARAFRWPRSMGSAAPIGKAAADNDDTSGRPIASARRTLMMAASWLVASWTHWVHLRAKGYIVVIECAQPLPRLLPQPDLVFVVSSESDRRSRQSHQRTQRPASLVFDGSSHPTDRAGEVERLVREWFLSRAGTHRALFPTNTE